MPLSREVPKSCLSACISFLFIRKELTLSVVTAVLSNSLGIANLLAAVIAYKKVKNYHTDDHGSQYTENAIAYYYYATDDHGQHGNTCLHEIHFTLLWQQVSSILGYVNYIQMWAYRRRLEHKYPQIRIGNPEEYNIWVKMIWLATSCHFILDISSNIVAAGCFYECGEKAAYYYSAVGTTVSFFLANTLVTLAPFKNLKDLGLWTFGLLTISLALELLQYAVNYDHPHDTMVYFYFNVKVSIFEVEMFLDGEWHKIVIVAPLKWLLRNEREEDRNGDEYSVASSRATSTAEVNNHHSLVGTSNNNGWIIGGRSLMFFIYIIPRWMVQIYYGMPLATLSEHQRQSWNTVLLCGTIWDGVNLFLMVGFLGLAKLLPMIRDRSIFDVVRGEESDDPKDAFVGRININRSVQSSRNGSLSLKALPESVNNNLKFPLLDVARDDEMNNQGEQSNGNTTIVVAVRRKSCLKWFVDLHIVWWGLLSLFGLIFAIIVYYFGNNNKVVVDDQTTLLDCQNDINNSDTLGVWLQYVAIAMFIQMWSQNIHHLSAETQRWYSIFRWIITGCRMVLNVWLVIVAYSYLKMCGREDIYIQNVVVTVIIYELNDLVIACAAYRGHLNVHIEFYTFILVSTVLLSEMIQSYLTGVSISASSVWSYYRVKLSLAIFELVINDGKWPSVCSKCFKGIFLSSSPADNSHPSSIVNVTSKSNSTITNPVNDDAAQNPLHSDTQSPPEATPEIPTNTPQRQLLLQQQVVADNHSFLTKSWKYIFWFPLVTWFVYISSNFIRQWYTREDIETSVQSKDKPKYDVLFWVGAALEIIVLCLFLYHVLTYYDVAMVHNNRNNGTEATTTMQRRLNDEEVGGYINPFVVLQSLKQEEQDKVEEEQTIALDNLIKNDDDSTLPEQNRSE